MDTQIDSKAGGTSRQRFLTFLRAQAKPNAKNPEEAAARKAGRQCNLRNYRDWLWPFRWELGLMLLLALVAAGLDLAVPIVTRAIVDRVLLASSPDMGLLPWLGGLSLFLVLLAQALESSRGYWLTHLNARAVLDLRQRLYRRFLALPMEKLGDLKTGGIVSRITSDVDSLGGLLQGAVVSPSLAAARIVTIVGILFFLSWPMALLALTVVPPVLWINLLWIRKLRPVHRSVSADLSESSGRVAETFGGIRVVRAFAGEHLEERRFATDRNVVVRKELYAARLSQIVWGGWQLLGPLSNLALVCAGAVLVSRGEATVGDIFAFQLYTMMLISPAWQIVNSMTGTQKAMAALDRVFEILNTPADKPDAVDAVAAPAEIRELVLDGVTFAYGQGELVLHEIDLRIPGGSVLALVGPSGAGKTTLADLLARFHDPSQGAIRLNGIDLRAIRLGDYRRLLGVVSQDVFLFDGTVRENLSYGSRHASPEEIEAAARRANAHEFIERLPQGYETVIGERGVKLSGGQRQRLSIARAFLADPRILILDEATSNLDTESEHLIHASMQELLRGRTTIVIAHRLSTVRRADRIVVLEAGRIAEQGTHEQLMAEGGVYRAMVLRQADQTEFRNFEEGPREPALALALAAD